MTWTIEFERAAAREFRKLDPDAKRRIRNFFQERILAGNDPGVSGRPPHGRFGGHGFTSSGCYTMTLHILGIVHRENHG